MSQMKLIVQGTPGTPLNITQLDRGLTVQNTTQVRTKCTN
jgi:hypothetical protein